MNLGSLPSEPADAVLKMRTARPLIAFSVYTAIQVDTLRDLGDRILSQLDRLFEDSPDSGATSVDGALFSEVYGRFWLWVLGAFEVIRTMSNAKGSFADSVTCELRRLQKRLAAIRIPFTKQQIAGRKQFIDGEASVSGIDIAEKDIRFTVDGKDSSARLLIEDFLGVVGSIQLTDIRKGLRSES